MIQPVPPHCWRIGLGIFLLVRSTWALSMAVPFGNHMVLQRNAVVPVWGKGTAGEQVAVTCNGQTKKAVTGANGLWRVSLDPMPAGGPFTLVAKGNTTQTYSDVMMGEVWQCAGQSNMDTRMSYSEYPSLADSIKQAKFPNLRFLTMRQPGQTIQWQQVSPTTVGALSATGYFFGRELLDHLDGVAVGLVVTAVGGTRIAQWMDPQSIAADPGLQADSSAGSQYDTWVAPVVGYAIAGTAWYQGEQDCSSALYKDYTPRLRTLIKAWRKVWGQGDFPFLICQLAHTHGLQTAAGGASNYGEIRESQRLVADSLANTWLEVNIDLGSSTTLHYDQKPIVGQRLGRLARGAVYQDPGLVNWRSPKPVAAWIAAGSVKVVVAPTAGGLTTLNGAAPAGFALAGSDGNWTWGTATLRGDTIVVQNPSVPKPTQIRYAFADFPIQNVVAGNLPLTPFRFTRLTSNLPVSILAGPELGAGWSLHGRSLVARVPAGATEASLELLSPDGQILSILPSRAAGGLVQWDLGPSSGIRLFRIQGRSGSCGKVVLP